MKKIFSSLLFLSLFNLGFSQAYQKPLDEVNKYLKIFDNGYYGYLEIKEGYLYDRYKSGEYSSIAIKDIDLAYVGETPYRVNIQCKDNKDCIFSTYTDSYHSYMDFSQEDKFNVKELEKLLNNLIASCKIEYEKEVAALGVVVDPNLEAKINELNRNSEANSKMPVGISRNGYQVSLEKLNAYLTKFNPETYRNIEVKEGKVYFSFAVFSKIYHSYITIDDLKNNVSIAQGNAFGDPEIRMRCNDDRKCFYSNYSNDYTDHFRFFSTTVEDLSELDVLLKDFIKAL